MKRTSLVLTLAAGAALAACSSNGLQQVPGTSPINIQSSAKLQFAVGTARLPDGTVGLNTVSTLRQSNGFAGTLVNSPTLTGPAGFTVPNSTIYPNGWGGSGSDAGTAAMTSLAQTLAPTPPPSSSAPYGGSVNTFGMSGGVFESGLAPFNTNVNGVSYYPGKPAAYGVALPTPTPKPAPTQPPAYGQPFFASSRAAQLNYIVGPPAVKYFNDGTYPSHFAGYLAGFMTFEVAPVAGSYTLAVNVATSNAGTSNFSQTATLGSLSPLPALPAPTFTKDSKGGGTVTVVVPSDPRIVETLLFVYNENLGYFYTIGPAKGTGTQSFVLPDMLGRCSAFGPSCETGPSAGASLRTGDKYQIYAASFDYPQFEAEPPGNLQQTPTIVGSSGQADVTLSPSLNGSY